MVQKSFGHTLTHVSGAPEALVSYLNKKVWRAAIQEGRLFISYLLLRIGFWREPLKEGLGLTTSYLVQYLLTVDLRLGTSFTIDS